MDSPLQDSRSNTTSYILLGVLLAMLAASFLRAWYWCSESWVRMGLGGGTNAGYSPGPLVPVLVLLMLGTRLRRLGPTPQIANQDLFHAAYMKVLHPIVVQVVALWYGFRGVTRDKAEIDKVAYGKRSIAVWVAWILLAVVMGFMLRVAHYATSVDPLRYLKYPASTLLFVEIMLFGAVVIYVGWRAFQADDRAAAAARGLLSIIVGAILIVVSLLVHFSATRGLMPQLSIVAFMGCLVGILWLFYGWRIVRLLVFPLAFMVLTLPMDWVETQIGLPAQVFATKYSVSIMEFLGLKIEMIGRTAFNVVQGQERISFDVDAPCSGLKSLVALTAISATYGYLTQKTTLKVIIIMACGPFLAIITNIIRLVTVGVTAHFFDRTWAMRVHDHALPIYILAVLLLMLIDKLINAKWLKIEDF